MDITQRDQNVIDNNIPAVKNLFGILAKVRTLYEVGTFLIANIFLQTCARSFVPMESNVLGFKSALNP